jgi:tRNA-2-methylthio-N6-dimethylallyladenosine synthase
VKAERLAGLQQLIAAQAQAFNAACVGRDLPVLLERPGRRPGQLVGRSPYMQAVHVDLPAAALARLAGRIVEVRIEAAHANSLAGRLPLGDAPHKAAPAASPARITA